MKVIFSDKAHEDINNLYSYSIWKHKNVLCHSAVVYLEDIRRSMEILKKQAARNHYKEQVPLINVVVYCRTVTTNEGDTVVLVTHIGFKNFRRLIQLCSRDRKTNITKYTINKSSKNVSDYKHIPKGECGIYKGNTIYIVKRKETGGLDLFNYMLGETTILSPYDFISCGDFFETDGEYKAKAAADRNHWYWVYPNSKVRKIDTKIQKESLDIPVGNVTNKLDNITLIRKILAFDFD